MLSKIILYLHFPNKYTYAQLHAYPSFFLPWLYPSSFSLCLPLLLLYSSFLSLHFVSVFLLHLVEIKSKAICSKAPGFLLVEYQLVFPLGTQLHMLYTYLELIVFSFSFDCLSSLCLNFFSHHPSYPLLLHTHHLLLYYVINSRSLIKYMCQLLRGGILFVECLSCSILLRVACS